MLTSIETDTACPAPDASPCPQLYAPGVPFVPRDRVPMTDDEVRERAVGVGQFGYVMFDKVIGA